MDVIEKLKQALRAEMKAQVPVQTVWATCKSTNLSQGTMVADADGLEYYDVLLGLGGDLVEPMPNSRVLLGVVANKAEACFLLYAEKTKYRHINGKTFGGVVKSQVVAQQDAAIIANINALRTALNAFVPTGVPIADMAALKAVFTTWGANTLVPAAQVTYENPKVKHG